MLHWGLGTGRGADPDPALLRPLDRPLRAQAPAGEVRGDRGALAEPATGQRGADRLARSRRASATASRSRSRSSAASSPRATGPPARSGWRPFPPEDRPSVLIPFFGFRIMVGMGLIMLAVSWFGNFLRWRGRLETTRWFLWVRVPVLPDRLHRHPDRLVHRRGRPPALGRLRPPAHERCGDAVFDRAVTCSFRSPCYVMVYAVYLGFGLSFTSTELLRDGPGGDATDPGEHDAGRPLAFANAVPAPRRNPR